MLDNKNISKGETKNSVNVNMENLQVTVSTDKLIKPIFFLPGENKNSVYYTDDMYTSAAYPELDILAQISGFSNESLYNYIGTLVNQFIDVLTTNINIILTNGVYGIMRNFGITPKYDAVTFPLYCEDVKHCIMHHLNYLVDKMKSNNKGDVEFKDWFMLYLSEVKAMITSKFASYLYTVIDTSVLETSINNNSAIQGYAEYIAIESGVPLKRYEDGCTNIDNSAASLVYNACIESATINNAMIAEITEVVAVQLAYKSLDVIKGYINSTKHIK